MGAGSSVVSHEYLTRCAASLEETQRAPGSVAPGAAAPPRHSAHYDSSARPARRYNPLADRASYLRDTALVDHAGLRRRLRCLGEQRVEIDQRQYEVGETTLGD